MEKFNNNIRHSHAGKSSESLLDKRAILKELDILPGQTVLDAGCGTGYMAKEFAKLVGENGTIYALDPHESSINALNTEIQGTVIEAFIGDITQRTKLPNSSIDLIYLSTVIHGFSKEQMNGFTDEINRILKPNGKLAILEIKKEDTPFGPPLELRFSPEELKDIIKLKPTNTVNIKEHFYLQIFYNIKG